MASIGTWSATSPSAHSAMSRSDFLCNRPPVPGAFTSFSLADLCSAAVAAVGARLAHLGFATRIGALGLAIGGLLSYSLRAENGRVGNS